jgi:hypothetical protein
LCAAVKRLGFVGGQAVGRLRNAQLVQHRGEKFPVLGDLNALRRGADDVDAVLLQASARFNGVCPPNCAIAPQHFSRS